MPKRLGRIAAAYFVLLITSHLVDWSLPRSAPPPDVRFAVVHVVDHGKTQPRKIRLAYRDSAPDSSHFPVILVHGSPGSGEVMQKLATLLAPRFRVIVPDLPGFGASTRDLPDYSFKAHADYLIELLDELHVPTAQFVGFSMGGGVVLSMAGLAPERVAAIVMLSGLGVQENELTGSYGMNHFVHGAQVGVLCVLQNGVPHFGLFRRLPFTIEYARNFYDSDQRPLRGILQGYRGPMLIIHGIRDHNVPVAAAWEHHRLVPQSEIFELEDDHFMAFMHPRVFADPLVQFLNRTR